MQETVNQENETVEVETETKTFTQDEVNRIIGERVAREREKYADYDSLKDKASKFDEIEEANKTELEKATEKANALQAELDGLKQAEAIRTMRDEVSAETGVPTHLITATDKEEAMEQAKAILEFTTPSAYPQVRDGGEVNRMKKTTKDQFADWLKNT